MANFSPKLFKAASQAEVLPVSKERSDEPFESPVFEEYLAKNDIAGYMTALWKGVPARDAESMRVLFYLSVKAEELDNALDILDMLLDMEDEYAVCFWHFMDIQHVMMEKAGTRDMDQYQAAFNLSLVLGDATYMDCYPNYKSLLHRFGDHETTLLRAYINNVGRIVEPKLPEEKEIEITPCAPQDKKDYWKSLYRRSDCSSNQIGIYHDAMSYAEKGDPYAMFIVGYLLNRGIRTKYSNPNVTLLESDHEKALPWLKRAAEAGITEACWETACALSNAWYVPMTVEDKMEEKIKYIKMGAEKDDPDCLEWLYKYSKDEHEQFNYLVRLADKYKTHEYTLELAKWYEEGKGCEKDEKKAFELAEYVYRHSSISPYDSSYEDAVSLLCRYLRDGIGCEPDPSRAADISSAYESEEDDMMELLSH
jgi:hypothetical protein